MGDFWTQDTLDDLMIELLFAHGFPGSFSLFQHLLLFYHPWLYGCIAPTVSGALADIFIGFFAVLLLLSSSSSTLSTLCHLPLVRHRRDERK
jgi:hypothetical protein